ncbi:hypothetical protein EYZ11_007894 [Aspergillus tanneri]|uniref:Aminoacyl-tRNA hydrolase n=1 Tax=Aspergillus tanneri TaxID=1220188 RepID=A0A4S3JE28_9EURO|nr:aminoacyl-tRNA hydrolase [Aspergillus tanneri]KAA8643135.1 aminoacyl-tRNA hydrolase [Aspergillus tanneri]THC92637.1 hypothetical protein EYZ11_007894 [Aspergillus tanneri]
MATTNGSLIKTPRRFLFIASIGNPRPYRTTRHSAGHILLDALGPLLPTRVPLVSSQAQTQPPAGPIFYKTWRSGSYMNESGPKLVRQLNNWMSTTETEVFEQIVQRGHVVALPETVTDTEKKITEWQSRGVDPHLLTRFYPTLVILHDELEVPLGKVRVRRGGPEKASLRGHRGLISVMESLRGKGLYPPRSKTKTLGDLSVLRIGVGIGRPSTRNRGDVADFVLTEMDTTELAAVKDAARPVLDILADELYRDEEDL